MRKLIILRGNSGSGKTTIAKMLRNSLPQGSIMTIGQDEIRRQILNVKDTPNKASCFFNSTARFIWPRTLSGSFD